MSFNEALKVPVLKWLKPIQPSKGAKDDQEALTRFTLTDIKRKNGAPKEDFGLNENGIFINLNRAAGPPNPLVPDKPCNT